MFRRKEDGTEEFISENDNSVTPVSTPANSSASSSPSPAAATPVMPSAPAFRPVPSQAAMAAARPPVTPAAQPAADRAAASERASAAEPARSPIPRPNAKRVLTVGPDIQMKGEITSCDRVIIEGMVDASMSDVHTVELAETGALKGTAEVEDAEISGSFEGDLTVRGKLTIHGSGRVRGNVTYGEIEIQRGGQISGNIRTANDAKNAGNHNNKKAA